MSEVEQICPYTGLRSFTEEESLYFKGREEDIDRATEQLQRNKFLMLTGASGDGKSSLIYAGIIPNARAGFLKSKYTQWCVADFRPERTPFDNLCKAIARQLDIPNHFTVQSELNHGFSAIIDLYKNSKRYIDTNSVVWKQADDAGKAALKREAANLIILVDQFEEFFTNPENYHKGVPSADANLVLNLLLETSRIALEEDLPVYIVFTMRSDYIGQCAAFRGLPEYIGFSQFFVPRLNRTQLQQVIEEPATLSGNRITRRLTERLIHDLTEGVDQLPIVQHALNQIWHAADNGREEMDLIHYAMVGGMPVNELPDEQIDRFNKWFERLPDHIKACYHEPNLQNVLDTHTNKLYEQAADYYQQKTGKPISDEDAKAIIRTAFICLTKIDQSRAVRNRMTLKEITSILNRPEFGSNEVGNVLNIFREPGNTFIRPFMLEDSGKTLTETDILDITHESLIRNWEYLEQWAKEEFNNYTISLDFEQQLNRWVSSDKSSGFLLPIGPLTYFENWFKTSRPNAYWIARYLPEEIDEDKKLANANQVLSNSQEFLKRSARKHGVTRTIMRYGPKRIAILLGLIAVVTLSSFAIRNYFRRQNDFVLKNLKSRTLALANIPKLSPEFPIPPITEELILGDLTVPDVISGITDLKQKIKIGTGIASQLVQQGRYEPQKEILQSLTITDSLMEQLTVTGTNAELSAGLRMINDFKVTAGFASYFNADPALASLVKHNAKRAAHWSMQILKEQPKGFMDIQGLSQALDNGINHKIFSQDEIHQLLKIISPFENNSSTPWLDTNYHRDKLLVRGGNSYGQKFNGLYQDLSYLYAAEGNPEKVLQCMDTILHYQESYYQLDYNTHVENATNIAAVFYIYGTTDKLDSFVQGYCQRKNITTAEFYNRLVSRALMDPDTFANIDFYGGGSNYQFSNLNIKFSSDDMLSFFFVKLKEEILKIKDSDERNLTLAVVLKNEAMSFGYRNDMRGIADTGNNELIQTAIQHYQLVSKVYLDQLISIAGSTIGSNLISMPRKFLFLYPDYRVPFLPFEPRRGQNCFQSPVFIRYLLDHDLLDKLYESPDEFKYLGLWLLEYQQDMFSRDISIHDQVPNSILEKLASKLEESKADQSTDLNVLYLHLCLNAFDLKEPDKAIAYFKHIQVDKLLNLFQANDFFLFSQSFEMMGKLIGELTVNDHFDLAYSLINVFKKEINRSSLYGYASQMISFKKQSPEVAQRLIDSARMEMKRLDKPEVFQPNRHNLAIALMSIDPEKNSKEAYHSIKNSFGKFDAIGRFSRAYAFHGNLYQAQQQAPILISTADKAYFLQEIIMGYNMSKPLNKEWIKFKENEPFFFRRYLVYINENQ